MTARELIKMLECFNLDKPVNIIVSVELETEEGYEVILKPIETVVESLDLIAIQ